MLTRIYTEELRRAEKVRKLPKATENNTLFAW